MVRIRHFAHNGWIVHHPNPEQDPDFDNRGAEGYAAAEFQGRRPIVVNPDDRHIYVGEPNWYHGDVEDHHNLREGWSMEKGYFGAQSPDWGNGKLAWYGGAGEDHNDVAQALIEAGFDIPNADSHTLDKGLDDEPAPEIDWLNDD